MKSRTKMKQNIVEEWCRLAQQHYYGEGVKQDISLAVEYYQKAADRGNIPAAFNAGSILMDEKSSAFSMSLLEQVKNIIKYLSQAADQTKFPAQSKSAHCRLYNCYLYGAKGISKDMKLAFHHLKRAADLGDSQAQLDLAAFVIDKQTKMMTGKECYELLKTMETASQNARVYGLLGMCYQKGIGVEQDINKAIEYYQKGIDRDNTDAITYLCGIYEAAGKSYHKQAVEYFKKAVRLGHGNAFYHLARLYFDGGTEVENKEEAVRLFKELLENETVDAHLKTKALVHLAYAYTEGLGVEADGKIAFEYSTRAAERGDRDAQLDTAKYLMMGEIIPKNIKRAIHYLNLAADKGSNIAKYLLATTLFDKQEQESRAFTLIEELVNNSEFKKRKTDWTSALCYLGIFNLQGFGTEENPKKAVDIFNQVVKEAVPDSMTSNRALFSLATCYLYGLGLPKNEVKGFRLLKLVEPHHQHFIFAKLGECYKSGRGTPKDLAQARHYFELAADGNPAAKTKLIGFYLLGLGGEKKQDEAIKLLRESNTTKSGVQNTLGICHLQGWGTAQNADRGIELLKASNAQGNNAAGTNLGWCYLLGLHVAQDRNAAVEYFKIGTQKGYLNSTLGLAWCYLNGFGVDCDPIRAQELFYSVREKMIVSNTHPQFAFSFGNCFLEYDLILRTIMADPMQNYNLALCYLNGWGVEKDQKKAFELFSSLANEYPDAKRQVANCYMTGFGVEQDYDHAVKILFELYQTNVNDIRTATLIAQCHYQRQYLETEEIIEILEACLDKQEENDRIHCADAHRLLAVMSEHIGDEDRAIREYHAAAALGNIEANFQLGYLYNMGMLGLVKDARRAVQYYSIAAERGHAGALYNLGVIYELGVYSDPKKDPEYEIDLEKAITYYKQAAALNDAHASFQLGRYFAHGLLGLNVDLAKAKDYLEQALSLGHPDAEDVLRSLEDRRLVLYQGTPLKDEPKAAESAASKQAHDIQFKAHDPEDHAAERKEFKEQVLRLKGVFEDITSQDIRHTPRTPATVLTFDSAAPYQALSLDGLALPDIDKTQIVEQRIDYIMFNNMG